MNLLVSACLLGASCRYDGRAKPCQAVMDLGAAHLLVPFCPEVYGGLPTPRPPAERAGDRVLTQDGSDLTAAYRKGAEEALRMCRLNGCEAAVLKARSPSCGSGAIYDGTFGGRLIPGYGVTAALLIEAGLQVVDENGLGLLRQGRQPAEDCRDK